MESKEPVEPMSIAAQSPAMLAEYLSSKQAKTFSKMTAIELEDMQIPGADPSSSGVSCVHELTIRQKCP